MAIPATQAIFSTYPDESFVVLTNRVDGITGQLVDVREVAEAHIVSVAGDGNRQAGETEP